MLLRQSVFGRPVARNSHRRGACEAPRIAVRRPQHSRPAVELHARLTDTGSLNPGAYWYPAWLKYRQRPDNYSFWQKKFLDNSLQIPDEEKRWTILSTLWWVVRWWHFYMIPAYVRFIASVIWRSILLQAYYLHRRLILQQAKLDAHLMQKYHPEKPAAFSKTMALRRLHFKNSLLGEVLYYINLVKTGRVHMLPPVRKPVKRPSLFIFF